MDTKEKWPDGLGVGIDNSREVRSQCLLTTRMSERKLSWTAQALLLRTLIGVLMRY